MGKMYYTYINSNIKTIKSLHWVKNHSIKPIVDD